MAKMTQVAGAAALLFASLQAAQAQTAGSMPSVQYLKDGTIAYAMTSLRWATYLKPDARVDCPDGVNDGPREQFAALFPGDGKPRALADTQLQREIQNWFPTTRPDYFPFREPGGTQALGLDLDGKVDPEDFTSLDGKPGIDNQMYRALGCINSHRDAQGINDSLNSGEIVSQEYNRTLVELNGVDDLANDEAVEVMIYRRPRCATHGRRRQGHPAGRSGSTCAGAGNSSSASTGRSWMASSPPNPSDLFIPGGLQPAGRRIPARREAAPLSLTRAEGLIAGFTDVESWHLEIMKLKSMRSPATRMASKWVDVDYKANGVGREWLRIDVPARTPRSPRHGHDLHAGLHPAGVEVSARGQRSAAARRPTAERRIRARRRKRRVTCRDERSRPGTREHAATLPFHIRGTRPVARYRTVAHGAARAAAFEPEPAADDAAVFAAARGHFLIPEGVAYRNTGTLGASPWEVMWTEGYRRLETDLAAWPNEQPDGSH